MIFLFNIFIYLKMRKNDYLKKIISAQLYCNDFEKYFLKIKKDI